MGVNERHQIQSLIADDVIFRSEIAHASSAADAVRFARHHHIDAEVEDFADVVEQLSERELATAREGPFSPTVSRGNICY